MQIEINTKAATIKLMENVSVEELFNTLKALHINLENWTIIPHKEIVYIQSLAPIIDIDIYPEIKPYINPWPPYNPYNPWIVNIPTIWCGDLTNGTNGTSTVLTTTSSTTETLTFNMEGKK